MLGELADAKLGEEIEVMVSRKGLVHLQENWSVDKWSSTPAVIRLADLGPPCLTFFATADRQNVCISNHPFENTVAKGRHSSVYAQLLLLGLLVL